MTFKELYPHVNMDYSDGRTRDGSQYVYIRPAFKCDNKSRRIKEGEGRIRCAVEKYYTPCNYYVIENKIIGAATEQLALREYWKICEKSKIKQKFAVQLLPLKVGEYFSLEEYLEMMHNSKNRK